jgi:glycosyltransferase involved in cell wall biosynthesis
MRDLFHSATRLQAWSHWAKQSVVDDYGVPEDKIVVNPPGVDLGRWRPRPDARERRRPAQVLFVGGDFRRKGGDVLLDWFRTQNPDEVELQIVTREEVAPRRGVHVHRDMQPNSEQLTALYHQCDVFVLPSLGECFGIATVEAMATGLPVVVTDVGGTADIVEPGRNGYLVTPNSVGELSQAIDAILSDDARRSWMGLQARRMAEVRFDLETNAKRTIDELKRMALERRPR